MRRFPRGIHRLEGRGRRRSPSPTAERLEDRLVLSTFVVTSTSDTTTPVFGVETLRDAIERSNTSADPGVNQIQFQLGSGEKTILLKAPLPILTHPVVIDGLTQPGANGQPAIVLKPDPSLPTFPGAGLTVYAGGSTVRGLILGGFDGAGVVVARNGGDVIENNVIGTNGTVGAGNAGDGILIKAVPNNVIRNNVIAGNAGGAGVLVSNDGTTPRLTQVVTLTSTNILTGQVLVTLFIDASPQRLFGTFSLSNPNPDVTFATTPGRIQSTVSRPNIGPSIVSGTVTFPSNGSLAALFHGVALTSPQTSGTLTGTLNKGVFTGTFTFASTLSGAGTTGTYTFTGNILVNPVSPFGTKNPNPGTVTGPFTTVVTRTITEASVPVPHNPTDNIIENNFIGTNRGGSAQLGNGIGVEIDGLGSDSNVLRGNVIVANATDGVFIDGGASQNRVEAANVISGNASVGVQVFGGTGNAVSNDTIAKNGRDGVFLNATSGSVVIGNTVNQNQGVGVQVFAATGNTIQANAVLENGTDGVFLNAASGNVVAGNAISGNTAVGVHIAGGTLASGASHNQVLGNTIEDDLDGVAIEGPAAGNVIGGVANPAGSSPGNIVVDNRRSGINILGAGATGNAVLGNLARGNHGFDVVLQRPATGNIIGGPRGAANDLSTPVSAYFGGLSRNRIGQNTRGHSGTNASRSVASHSRGVRLN